MLEGVQKNFRLYRITEIQKDSLCHDAMKSDDFRELLIEEISLLKLTAGNASIFSMVQSVIAFSWNRDPPHMLRLQDLVELHILMSFSSERSYCFFLTKLPST